LEVRFGVLEEKNTEFKRGAEARERKQWTVVVAGLAAVLSLVVNLVLLFFKK